MSTDVNEEARWLHNLMIGMCIAGDVGRTSPPSKKSPMMFVLTVGVIVC